MNFPYEDILSLPHPVSSRHARMSDADRAAQFSPFAALNGHEEAINETARLTDMRIELDENEKERLNEQLQTIARRRLPDGDRGGEEDRHGGPDADSGRRGTGGHWGCI